LTVRRSAEPQGFVLQDEHCCLQVAGTFRDSVSGDMMPWPVQTSGQAPTCGCNFTAIESYSKYRC
jgi:hypothetical protein